MATRSASLSRGFVKKSKAPDFIACTDISMLPWPVRKMIGTWTSAFASSPCTSRPLIPGSFISSTRQLGSLLQHRLRNSCGDAKLSTLRPAVRIRPSTDSRTDASSSTTYTDWHWSLTVDLAYATAGACVTSAKNLLHLGIGARRANARSRPRDPKKGRSRRQGCGQEDQPFEPPRRPRRCNDQRCERSVSREA